MQVEHSETIQQLKAQFLDEKKAFEEVNKHENFCLEKNWTNQPPSEAGECQLNPLGVGGNNSSLGETGQEGSVGLPKQAHGKHQKGKQGNETGGFLSRTKQPLDHVVPELLLLNSLSGRN